MDRNNAPGIQIEGVHLLSCSVGEFNPEVTELSYNLGLYDKQRSVSDDGKALVYYLAFDLMKGIDPAPFEFRCGFCVKYTRDDEANMSWDEFTDTHALTHVIPYIREFVVNLTSRMLVPTLSIPPINVFVLLREYEGDQSTADANDKADSSA